MPVVLLLRLAALAEAVAELRDAQRHAAQAAAARAAAERLYAAARPAPVPSPRTAPRASTAAQLAAMSFPKPARPGQRPPATEQTGPGQVGLRSPYPAPRHHGRAVQPADLHSGDMAGRQKDRPLSRIGDGSRAGLRI
jgi:hypothetical protein